jgi:hypothetical protein
LFDIAGPLPVVRGSVLMKAEKMAPIGGYENPVLCRREDQNFVVRHGRNSPSGL